MMRSALGLEQTEKTTEAMKPMQSTTPDVEAIAARFFELYRAQDVPEMVALFTEDGIVEYVPMNLKGPVGEAGAKSWRTLIDGFPDLTNRINDLYSDKARQVAFVDVHLIGTQAKEVLGIPNQGEHYELRHLFVIKVNDIGRITSMTAFWDNGSWYQQLGKTTLD